MKRRLNIFRKTTVFAVIIAILLVSTLLTTVFAGTLNIGESSANATITYSFTGDDKDLAGFAQGTITVKASSSANAGKYYLYWADDTKALDGYTYISILNVTTSGASVTLVAQTAIPADATKLVAFKADSEPSVKTVATATAVYNIPQSKQFPHKSTDKQYSFASYSDIHIANDSYGSSCYPYDEQHFRNALDAAAKRDVDFIVTSGDNINNQEGKTSASEWKTYQKILAESDYCNPIYETIGNHEIWSTPVSQATKDFVKATGLKCDSESLSSDKAYYTFDEPTTGDHFIIMALETNFYPDRYDEFSTEQINWVKGLLEKYKNDGHNTYIYEHSSFWKWGVGDDTTKDTPYYDIPLKVDYTGNKALQQILYDYPDAFFFCGHTHIWFSDQFNYMDYDTSANKATAKMIHNSSVGGIRKVSGNTLDRTNNEDEIEGYFVDCYGDYVICNGANLYYNTINPLTTYIVEGTGVAGATNNTTTTSSTTTTSATTTEAKKYNVSYNIAGSAYLTPESAVRTVEENKAFQCTLSDNSGKTPSQTETYTKTVTVTMGGVDITSSVVTSTGSDVNQSFTINIPKVTGNVIITAKGEAKSSYQIGDVNMDSDVDIMDAVAIQKHLVGKKKLTDAQLALADVNGDDDVDIMDATRIQKYLAGLVQTLTPKSSKSISSVGAQADTAVGTSKSDLQELMDTVGTYLSSKYTYSSYDQYMAVKKEYRYCKSNINSFTTADIASHYNSLNEKFKTLEAIAGESTGTEGSYTVYFKNTSSWSTVYAYCWTGSTNNTWPGETMTKVKDNIYKITVDSSYEHIIFNNNSSQTPNLDIQGNNYIYDYSTKTWSQYSE